MKPGLRTFHSSPLRPARWNPVEARSSSVKAPARKLRPWTTLLMLLVLLTAECGSGPVASMQELDPVLFLPLAGANPCRLAPACFEFKDSRLTISTWTTLLSIERGSIVYVQDKSSGEVLVDARAAPERPVGETEDLVGFLSADAGSNVSARRPLTDSLVSFVQDGQNRGRLTYTIPDPGGADPSHLIIESTIYTGTGEIVLQLTGLEGDAARSPFAIDMPILASMTPSVILGSGAQYFRADDDAVDQTSYPDLGLNGPTMAVLQGADSTLAVWSETTTYAPEYIRLDHKPSGDNLVLHVRQDPQQTVPKRIVSAPWRIGTYPAWVKAARRWREQFEARTGARPLWESRTEWVRKIHAEFNAVDQSYDAARYAELASKAAPESVVYFLWNGDRIVLFGDHTLVAGITRPTAQEVDAVRKYGWPMLLYHPYNLIYTETAADNRLLYLDQRGWLPPGYEYAPDYGGSPGNWHAHWADVKASVSRGPQFDVLHPGSNKFTSYLARNLADYCTQYGARGAYLDTLGDAVEIPVTGTPIVDGYDYTLGEQNAIAKFMDRFPQFAVMSEYQASWILPFAFFSWEGPVTHLKQSSAVGLRLNHPLRLALTGSYSWARESNSEQVDDVADALLGSLPAISLVGDAGVSEEQARWSQARAALFVDEQLFNDLPPVWEDGVLAYYRSKSGNWFKFERLGSAYAYVEVLPDGRETVRLSR